MHDNKKNEKNVNGSDSYAKSALKVLKYWHYEW